MEIQKINQNHQDFLSTQLGKKFVNRLMIGGKKSIAEKIFLQSLVLIQSVSNKNPIQVLILAIFNVKPVVEIRSIRMRGANYQVPIPLQENRRISLAIKWIVESANKKKGNPMKIKLKEEIILASKKQGESVKKKLSVHRLANANRAFVHYRWF
jgi:small subunit ribosomal protein S7